MKRFLLVVLVLFPLAAAALSDREALGLFNRARSGSAAALAELRKAAQSGDAPAQFQLGRAYSHGASVPRDDATAARWVEQAAEQGHLEAQSNIGFLYSGGQGVPRDNDKAIAWWTRAAERGFAEAQFNLAIAYQQGKLTAKNDAKAFAWMSKAAAQGIAPAQLSLGHMYSRGTGTAQDERQAIAWYRKAAQQGNTAAMRMYDDLCEKNPGRCEAPKHFVFEMTGPKLKIVIPDAPPMRMGPHPLAGTQPQARFMGSGAGGFSISVLTPTASPGMTPADCASSISYELVRRYGLKPEGIVRRRPDESTYILLFPVNVDSVVQLKAYLMSGHGGHCIEVHLSRTVRAEKDVAAWFKGFAGARIELR
jgi:TPR repeat protein